MTGRSNRKPPLRPSGFSPENVPENIKTGIGELITQWSYVAFQIGVIIRVGFGLEREVGFALLFETEIQPLCRSLRTLATSDRWILDKGLCVDLRKLADDVQDKKERRHDFAHGVFGFKNCKDGQTKFVRYRFGDVRQRRKTPAYDVVTPDLLRDLADEAYDLGRRAQDLTVRLKALRGSKKLPKLSGQPNI